MGKNCRTAGQLSIKQYQRLDFQLGLQRSFEQAAVHTKSSDHQSMLSES
jgi:hypothetical protein